ncbi:MAG: DNA ligase (NAD(+)) LigA, partial [Spirochaetes bacterium]
MTRDKVKKRIEYLVNEVRRHQDLYYKKAQPEISDREYDALFDELLKLERRYPDLALPDSPTKRVGSDLDNEFPEVRHPFPMLSLDKVYTIDELESWIEKSRNDTGYDISFTVEEKIDGSTIVLHYENGILVRAVTRGDGFVGNDITENVRTIKDIPLRLSEPVTSIFRGEIYIDRKDFEKLNSQFDSIYANPRNFAAGSLRRKKSSEVAKIPLKSYVYEGFYGDVSIKEHLKVLHKLTELGFRVFDDVGYFSSTIKKEYDNIFKKHTGWVRGTYRDIDNFIIRMKEVRDKLPYDIDGLVVKINEYPIRDKLGYTAHHPRWAMAFKFEAPQAVSEILDIDVQVGRTGRITPVARIKPVWIAGTTVSNVTLHNQDYINSLDVAIGDVVAVSRHGDVIPAVDEVIEKNDKGNKTFKLPDTCPVCGTPLIQDGAHLFCPNRNCPARIYGRISFFVGKGQMDIENLGPE